MDRATTAVLQRLRRGPASTVELQAELYATHVPKQIFDLRREGFFIKTTRLPNGVALYTLLGLVLDVPVGAAQGKPALDTPRAAPTRAPDSGLGTFHETWCAYLQAGAQCNCAWLPINQRERPQFGDATVVAGSHSYQAHSPRPQFGDPALLREMRSKGRR